MEFAQFIKGILKKSPWFKESLGEIYSKLRELLERVRGIIDEQRVANPYEEDFGPHISGGDGITGRAYAYAMEPSMSATRMNAPFYADDQKLMLGLGCLDGLLRELCQYPNGFIGSVGTWALSIFVKGSKACGIPA